MIPITIIFILGLLILALFIKVRRSEAEVNRFRRLAKQNKGGLDLEAQEILVSERMIELLEKERLLSNMIDNLPGVIIQFNDDEHLSPKYISRGADVLFGMTIEEVNQKGLALKDFIHPDHFKKMAMKLEEAKQRDSCENVVPFLIDGKTKWILNRGKYIPQDGQPGFFECILLDITQQVVSQQALVENERRLSIIYNHTRDLMGLINVEDESNIILESVNMPTVQYLKKVFSGFKNDEYTRMEIDDFYRNIRRLEEPEIQKRMDLIKEARDSKVMQQHEIKTVADTGDVYVFEIHFIPVLDEKGHCTHVLLVSRDITEVKMSREKVMATILETEIKERQRIAKELHDSLGQNLAAVSINFSALEKEIKSKLDEQYLEKYRKGVNTLNIAIKESRNIAHNIMPQAISDFGFVKAVEGMLDGLESSLIKFSFYNNLADSRLDSKIETILYRITQGAVSNIIKHADCTRATIQLMKHKDELLLTIEDNGKGFDPAKTNGFGLTSMASWVEAISGNIFFDSRLGNGTTISINIPYQRVIN